VPRLASKRRLFESAPADEPGAAQDPTGPAGEPVVFHPASRRAALTKGDAARWVRPRVVRPLLDRLGPSPELREVITAYRRYAFAYDVLFGAVFQRGRAMTVDQVNRLGGARVLEVGVGTGLSLPRYRRHCRIAGIDVSGDMLAIGQRRIERRRLDNVDSLLRMDARHLAFADGAFDVIVAMYVMSVAPEPRRCLAEMQRVCAPGGSILICNHFVRPGERWLTPLLEPLSRWLGWHPNFSMSQLLDGSRLQVVSNRPVPPFGLFRLVTLRKP
jgi:phosphatidylethanolamine/phosphatidyl-N-methylethanolamine N-methyltransferase